jgi:hypothetical protein
MVFIMNKTQRRQLMQLMEEDTCSICGAEAPHYSTLYGGVTSSGEVAVVGECCRSKLKCVYATGLYVSPNNRLHS